MRSALVRTRSPVALLNRAVASGLHRIRWQRLHSEFETRARSDLCDLRVNCTYLETLAISCIIALIVYLIITQWWCIIADGELN